MPAGACRSQARVLPHAKKCSQGVRAAGSHQGGAHSHGEGACPCTQGCTRALCMCTGLGSSTASSKRHSLHHSKLLPWTGNFSWSHLARGFVVGAHHQLHAIGLQLEALKELDYVQLVGIKRQAFDLDNAVVQARPMPITLQPGKCMRSSLASRAVVIAAGASTCVVSYWSFVQNTRRLRHEQ